MAKEYYSKSLDKILNKYIHFGKYGIATPILKDIFQRRAYEFGFSNEHMQKEIEKFSKNCRKVRFLQGKNFSRNSLGGIYDSTTKNININLDETAVSILRKKDKVNNTKHGNKELYSTIAHEVFHAILRREDIITGLMYLDEDYHEQGIALNEIITEQAANRISKYITPKNGLATQGYSEMTPVVNLLAAACGISDKELLKAGTQSREELTRVILQKFPIKEHDRVKDILKKFEVNLDLIYNIHYTQGKKELDEKVSSKVYSELEEISYILASSQMSNNENLTPIEKAIRLKRIEQIGKYLNDNFVKFENTDVSKRKKEEILSMPGVGAVFLESDDRFDKEYTSEKEWNNSFIDKYIDFLYKLKTLKEIPAKYKNTIMEYIHSNGKKMLNSGNKHENSIIYPKTDFDRRYKVNEENLKTIKEITREKPEKQRMASTENKGFSK